MSIISKTFQPILNNKKSVYFQDLTADTEARGLSRWGRLALLKSHSAPPTRGYAIQGVIAETPAHPQTSWIRPSES